MLEKQSVMLTNYHQFDGIHWDTGTIRNALDYQGVTAPHTGQPLSEALLFGVSGGIVAGYFTFEYTGLDPWLHFITRNTFDPQDTLLKRLNIPVEVKQTDDPDKAVSNLVAALSAGRPALVYADYFSLPYNNEQPAADNYMLFPVLIYGYDGDTAYIADRARVPLTVSAADLAAARARTASNKHRLLTLGAPDLNQLSAAVAAGLGDVVRNMTEEAPLKPMRGKFGLDAFARWADLLADTKTRNGWLKAYPGVRLYAVLKSAYHYIHRWGTGGAGARPLFADFLDEAALLLDKPDLKDAADLYRSAAGNWRALLTALLPDDLPPFKETRDLLEREYGLFLSQGSDSLPERQAIRARLDALRAQLGQDFPLSDTESAVLRDNIRHHVLQVQAAEKSAVESLKKAMNY